MAVLPIRKHGDPVLREKASIVHQVNREIKDLAKHMSDTMYNAPGAGLAATQLGVLKRVIVYDIGEGLQVLLNPEIFWMSEDCAEEEEGCLSFYEIKVKIKRPQRIKVRAKSLDNENMELEAEDLEARVIQHEVDHLDGIVILDRTDRSEQRKALKQIREIMNTHY